jgi:hypothetical protein
MRCHGPRWPLVVQLSQWVLVVMLGQVVQRRVRGIGVRFLAASTNRSRGVRLRAGGAVRRRRLPSSRRGRQG